jgi:8-oxo-dGTP pyrophosphatase MutT (NUDIX family)
MTIDDARADLSALLCAYREHPTHAAEAATIDRYRAFIEAHDDCFARSCLEGHITGSAFIVNEALDKVLLVHHRKLGKWLQPGGHCEAGESALQAALREAHEETGITGRVALGGALFDLDIHAIPERAHEPGHFHYDARFLLIAREDEPVLSGESHALAWLDIAEALRRNPEPSMLRPLSRLQSMATAFSVR